MGLDRQTGEWRADVTVTGRDGTQLRIAGYGIAYRHSTPEAGIDRYWTLIDVTG